MLYTNLKHSYIMIIGLSGIHILSKGELLCAAYIDYGIAFSVATNAAKNAAVAVRIPAAADAVRIPAVAVAEGKIHELFSPRIV